MTATRISRSLSSDRTLKSCARSAAQRGRKSSCHASAWADLQAVHHHLRAVPAAAVVLPHPAQGASNRTVIKRSFNQADIFMFRL